MYAAVGFKGCTSLHWKPNKLKRITTQIRLLNEGIKEPLVKQNKKTKVNDSFVVWKIVVLGHTSAEDNIKTVLVSKLCLCV